VTIQNIRDSAAFVNRVLPAPRQPAFAMDDYWVWCGSVVKGDDNRYHMFASRWPKSLPFAAGYVVRSEIVRAVADRPEGPYEFQEVVLAPRDGGFWDGRMTHNPNIIRIGSRFALFYIGATYQQPPPPDAGPIDPSIDRATAYRGISIGVALADHIAGPWQRPDRPVLVKTSDGWDSVNVTNPAACVRPDGSILLVYRSSWEGGKAMLGAAIAEEPDGQYRRVSDQPVLPLAKEQMVEDPFIWHNGDHYEMIGKDLQGNICGEYHGGFHAVSADGTSWRISEHPHAYSRTVQWQEGGRTTLGARERPQLLIEDGSPTHLFTAVADGPGGFGSASNTWNMVAPLRR